MRTFRLILCCASFVMGTIAHAQETKNVTICWDVSLSMQNRDMGKEYYFLDAYFKNVQDASVTLLTFNNRVVSQDVYQVSKGNWTAIKEKLGSLTHDGGTSFGSLSSYTSSGDILLFTDGKQNMGNGTPNFSGQLYVINSNKNFDRGSLNLLSIVNDGTLVDFNEKKDSDNMVKPQSAYSGTIYSGTMGLAGAEVYVQGNEQQRTTSNEKGIFEINGVPGDTLIVSYGNKLEKQVLGENRIMDFTLGEMGIQLQEVVVSDRRNTPGETVITGYGEENKDKVGYAVQSISEDDISDAASTVNMAVQGKFSGVNLGQNDDLSQVTMRPRNTLLGNVYGLIVIDGVPVRQSDSRSGTVFSTDFINPENIADITVLKGLAATNRFGSMGVNGVLLITSKTATYAKEQGKKMDRARLTDNIYEEKVRVNNKTLVTPYLKELKGVKSVREAYDIYLAQRNTYLEIPEYFLDVSNFFRESSPEIAERILSNILEMEAPSYESLRGLFLKSVELEDHKMAIFAAERMLGLFPNKIQSYFDVALAHKNAGDFQEALNTLNGMASGEANPQLNFTPMEKVIGTEIRNLVNRKDVQLDVSKVDQKYRNNLTYNARLVLDWNQSDAEFSVQFVNPQKRFFNWEHTQLGERKRILDEIEYGYSSEQFEITGPETKGEWILNVTYLGNRTPGNQTATFLKCTVDYNFGKPNQKSEAFLVRLQEDGEEQQLAKFTVD